VHRMETAHVPDNVSSVDGPQSWQTLERTRLVDDVTNRLRKLIIDGTLVPGEQLRQVEAAQRLGVSRTPLREALRILEREGFVRTRKRINTAEVVDLSLSETIELYEFRAVIDGLAARLSARYGISDSEYHQLKDSLHSVRTPTGPEVADQQAGGHADFHALIADLSHNRYVQSNVPIIRFTHERFARRLRSLDQEELNIAAQAMQRSEHDHVGILEAIYSGDSRAAESMALSHIRRTITWLSGADWPRMGRETQSSE
jgi:GntR family transcriptional regulator, vanillate catabolism transcriptional regulator